MPLRFAIDWETEGTRLHAGEPSAVDVHAASPALASFYNDVYNRAMMSNQREMSAEEVRQFYAEGARDGGRLFLLRDEHELVGDADLRHIQHGAAEFAIMIGARSKQGRGLGRRFAIMVHALAFGELGLDRVYVTILPNNLPSIRLFQSLGYTMDDSVQARVRTDAPTDVSMSIERDAFRRRHAEAISEIGVTPFGAEGSQAVAVT